jgi:Optic atrophy 3 protein (OPA3)
MICYDSYMQIWSSGYRVRNIKPLDPEKALKDGAEFVGETFIFGVSVGLLLWEYNRSAESAKKKAEKKRQEIRHEQAQLQAKLHALDIRLKAVEETVKEQTDTLLGISIPQPVGKRKKYQPPPETELVDIDAPILPPSDDDEEDKQTKNTDIESGPQNGNNQQQPLAQNRDEQPWWKFW